MTALQLIELIAQATSGKLENPINLVDDLRELIVTEGYEIVDHAYESAIGQHWLSQKCPNYLTIIRWNTMTGFEHPIPCSVEPDHAIFQIDFKKWDSPNSPKVHEDILQLILIIMMHDCTDCCNTLKYLTLSTDGVIAYADLRNAYHS